ncbi:MAG: hypothetical protein HY519_03220 [Candidatus Aenigmarchaeota archaeon]|nr:hypothetical protein [Candidatus Aenigmarchaeota archaeon]
MAVTIKADAEVLENFAISSDVYVLRIKTAKPIEFQAGQFVNFYVPKDSGFKVKSYSIASPPSEQRYLEFCIKRVEGGYVSTYLQAVKPGFKFQLMGPFGHFIASNDLAADAIFVATGTGISAVKPIIQQLLDNGFPHKACLLFGVRHEASIYYRELWEDLAKKHANFTFVPTLSRPMPEWNGETGYVQDWLKKNLKHEGQHLYICGLVKMVDEVAQLCASLGFPKENVHFEKYI